MSTLFGTEEWSKAVAIADGHERMRFLHDLFYEQLKSECGLSYVRSFEIVTAAANSGYHLFFGSNHETGLRKMKELMWDVDPLEGRRFRDSTDVQDTSSSSASPTSVNSGRHSGRALGRSFRSMMRSTSRSWRPPTSRSI